MTKPSIEIKPEEFSRRASIYLLGVASACRATPDEALKIILEAVAKHAMPSFEATPSHRQVTKEDVKAWLKSTQKDRQWLAEQCYVKKSAVDKWFEKGKDIPPAKVALIKQLMEKAVVPVSAKTDVKAWLKAIGKDRFWLAEKCLVSKKTIDDWLTSRGVIPETKLKFIEQLMEKVAREEVCHA